eukprot:431796-Pleurochrysis_carterae.AAC.1
MTSHWTIEQTTIHWTIEFFGWATRCVLSAKLLRWSLKARLRANMRMLPRLSTNPHPDVFTAARVVACKHESAPSVRRHCGTACSKSAVLRRFLARTILPSAPP